MGAYQAYQAYGGPTVLRILLPQATRNKLHNYTNDGENATLDATWHTVVVAGSASGPPVTTSVNQIVGFFIIQIRDANTDPDGTRDEEQDARNQKIMMPAHFFRGKKVF